MPNHVSNKLLIRGPYTKVQALLKQGRVTVNHPEQEMFGQTQPAKVEEMEFSLRGFVPPPDHPDYSSGGCSHRHGWGQEKEEHPNCWYVWNNKNWGTKWDCYDVRIANDVDTVLESLAHLEGEQFGGSAIYFDTAWAPPMPVVQKIVEQYPELEIELTFMDEDMFGGGGGRFLFKKGKLVESRDGINDRTDPEFVRLATDLKSYDPSDYEDEEDDEE